MALGGARGNPVFPELVARGTALRQSKGQGKMGRAVPWSDQCELRAVV